MDDMPQNQQPRPKPVRSAAIAPAQQSQDKYVKAEQARDKYVEAVVKSNSPKKVVVAGPGTGKTFLFKRVLHGKRKTLTLTFVNSLVEDLSLELCGISEVRTLHSFACSTLRLKLFPKLPEVVKEDARLLLGKDLDFDHIFHNRKDDDPHIPFFKSRKDYYNHYGYADAVFKVVKYFEAKKEKIPTYDQVVVDEFQDFNTLEVSLIDLLSEKSPILLAGDDDQALYDFKSASPEHIRQRYSDPASSYEAFSLPYCSRSTRVIVQAANNIVKAARANGNLTGRINKPYLYFDHKDKDQESDQNPRIAYCSFFAAQVPWFIQQQIEQIARDRRQKFSILIICPTRAQCRSIAADLRGKGFQSIEFVEKHDTKEPTLLDGLKLLLEDKGCSLGWRIVSELLLEPAEFLAVLKRSASKGAPAFVELVPAGVKKKVKHILSTLRAIRDGKLLQDSDRAMLCEEIGLDSHALANDSIKSDISSHSRRVGNPGLRKIPIRVTTIQSSKGLAEEYVFITHFDDRYLIKNAPKITDREICNLLVAVTRARTKLFLISTVTSKVPTFLDWISPSCVETLDGAAQATSAKSSPELGT
jgi:superfamily I DNA/RNA helicase